MMRVKIGAIVALAIGAAACGQGNSDNVMSPEANALQPADVNAALGPEDVNTTDLNVTSNDLGPVANSPAVTESASNNAAE